MIAPQSQSILIATWWLSAVQIITLCTGRLLLRRVWLHVSKTAALVSWIFWLHFWIVGGQGEASPRFWAGYTFIPLARGVSQYITRYQNQCIGNY